MKSKKIHSFILIFRWDKIKHSKISNNFFKKNTALWPKLLSSESSEFLDGGIVWNAVSPLCYAIISPLLVMNKIGHQSSPTILAWTVSLHACSIFLKPLLPCISNIWGSYKSYNFFKVNYHALFIKSFWCLRGFHSFSFSPVFSLFVIHKYNPSLPSSSINFILLTLAVSNLSIFPTSFQKRI